MADRRPRKRKPAAEGPNIVMIAGLGGGGLLLLIGLVLVLAFAFRRPPALPVQVRLLDSKDRTVAEGARRALAEAGTEALPPLVEGLDLPAPGVRAECATLLGALGPQGKDAFEPLVRRLVIDADPQVRTALRAAVKQVGTDAEISAALVRHLRSADSAMKAGAVTAAGELGSSARLAVPDLVAVFRESTGGLQNSGARALGEVGVGSEEVVAALGGVIGNGKNPATNQQTAVKALGKLGPKAVPHLAKGLNDRELVKLTADMLAGMGAEAAPAIPELVAAKKRVEAWRSADASAVFQSRSNETVTTVTTTNARGDTLGPARTTGSGSGLLFDPLRPDPALSAVFDRWREVTRALDSALERIGAAKDQN